MGLEDKVLRGLSTASIAGAATITTFTGLSCYYFSYGHKSEGLMYALAAACTASLTYLSYKRVEKLSKSEETGFFGLPNEVIKDLEKKNSGRHTVI